VTVVLLANVAATLIMVGVAWYVQVAHYPLFSRVGEAQFEAFHEAHSSRTSIVVIPPMVVEILTSFALIFDPPAGRTGLTVAGAALAAGTWAVTAPAAGLHSRIGTEGPRPALLSRLVRVNLVRTLLWSVHGLVVLLLVAAAIAEGV
jgi:hypothetical protein